MAGNVFNISAGGRYQWKVNAMMRCFFDRQAVKDMLDQRSLRFLNAWGNYTMHDIRKIVRYDRSSTAHMFPRDSALEKHSKPGSPPIAHYSDAFVGFSKSPLREKILYAYDAKSRSVVVGPARLEIKPNPDGKPVTQTLEEGGKAYGTLVLVNSGSKQRWMSTSFYNMALKNGVNPGVIVKKLGVVNVEARPYVRPGAKRQLTQEKISQVWKKANPET